MHLSLVQQPNKEKTIIMQFTPSGYSLHESRDIGVLHFMTLKKSGNTLYIGIESNNKNEWLLAATVIVDK